MLNRSFTTPAGRAAQAKRRKSQDSLGPASVSTIGTSTHFQSPQAATGPPSFHSLLPDTSESPSFAFASLPSATQDAFFETPALPKGAGNALVTPMFDIYDDVFDDFSPGADPTLSSNDRKRPASSGTNSTSSPPPSPGDTSTIDGELEEEPGSQPTTAPNLSDIGISPFGIWCKICNLSILTQAKAIKKHFGPKHWKDSDTSSVNYNELAKKLLTESSRMKCNHECLLASIKDQPTHMDAYICECGSRFSSEKLFNRHLKRDNSCRKDYETHCVLHRTVCGRLVLPFEVKDPCGDMEPDIDIASTIKTEIEPLLPMNETVSIYESMLLPMIQEAVNFRDEMKVMVLSWKQPSTNLDPGLQKLLHASEGWLELVRLHVARCYSDHRCIMSSFSSTTVDGNKMRESFNWHYTDHAKMQTELSQLLCFAWHHKSNILSEIKERVASKQNIAWQTVANCLHHLFLEDVTSVCTDTVVVQYCISRCFRVDRHGVLSMASCGSSASVCARVLAILRGATCSYINLLEHEIKNAMKEVVERARDCGNSHRLSVMIHFLRTGQEAKPKSSHCRFNTETGDIDVDGYHFPIEKIQTLVPRIMKECIEIFRQLFIGDEWKQVLNLQAEIWVRKSSQFFEFDYISEDGSKRSCHNLKLNEVARKDNFLLDHLTSYIEVIFHGFGGGSMRMTELSDLLFSKLFWHAGTVLFKSFSIKKAQYNAPEHSKEVDREIPQATARAYILYRLLYGQQDPVYATHSRSGRQFFMKHAMAHVFEFEEPPTNLQIRKFWTTIANSLFSEGFFQENVGELDNDVARLSGHTSSTHALHYSSHVTGRLAQHFRKYHSHIGGSTLSEQSGQPLNSADLLKGLRAMYGPSAQYLSSQQKEMVEASVSNTDRHMHVALPCGAGKSAVWTVPLAGAKCTGKEIGSAIILIPYIYLLSTQYEATKTLLESRFPVSVAMLLGKDVVNNGIVPPVLSSDNDLPDILFMTIEAAVKLLQFHRGVITHLVKHKLVRHMILDEIHSLYGEGFREVYDHFPFLASFQLQTITLSATVPPQLLPSLMSYLNLSRSPTLDDMKIIQGGDLFGSFPEGFRISVHQCTEHALLQSAVETVRRVIEPNSGHAIHVLVSSRHLVEEIGALLTYDDGYKCACVTSNSPADHQHAVAKAWSSGGDTEVLITTTIGLVGNENPVCRHLCIVGLMFNVFNNVQAIGRLRPNQRHPGGTITFIVPRINSYNNFDVERQKKIDGSYEIMAAQLETRGVISHTDHAAFLSVASQESVRQCLTDPRCTLVALAERFGVPQSKCSVCTNCLSSPIVRTAHQATAQLAATVRQNNSAFSLLQKLEQQCCFCKSENCNGQSLHCYGTGRCYKCGQKDHRVRECTVSYETFIKGKGCYCCLDTSQRQGYLRHTPHYKECHLQKRLIRLLIETHTKQSKDSQNQTDFEQFCQKIYLNKNTFSAFIHENRELLLSLEPIKN